MGQADPFEELKNLSHRARVLENTIHSLQKQLEDAVRKNKFREAEEYTKKLREKEIELRNVTKRIEYLKNVITKRYPKA